MAYKRTSYDELYWQYKGYVVLMLRKFMYIGYDESARVLSYLLEYKLFESDKGIAAAGPDKDKIMRVLTAHHVNYVISEFGFVQEIRSFEDNCFYKYLALASGKKENQPETDSVPVWKDDEPGQNDETDGIQLERPQWFKNGCRVTHNTYGSGEITKIGSDTFTVCFESEQEKNLIFPDAFENGFLRIEETELN